MPRPRWSLLYNQDKAHAHAERRSISGKVEFRAVLRKTALDNPDLPIDFVEELVSQEYPEHCPFCGEIIEELTESYIEDEDDLDDDDKWD